MSVVKNELELFEEFNKYIDLVWKNKNNIAHFIDLKNFSQLDKLIEHISLFNIKSKTHMFNVFGEFDWRSIETKEYRYNHLLSSPKAEEEAKLIAALYKSTHFKQFNSVITPIPIDNGCLAILK